MTCTVEHCERPARARGWCTSHYHRWRRHGHPTATPKRFLPKYCTLDGCDREHHALGLCRLHWHRQRQHGDPQAERPPRSTPPATEKWCTGCSTLLPVGAFARSSTRYDGLNGHCRDCLAGWRRENRDLRRAATNRRRASKQSAPGAATADQLTARWSYYGNRCWICREPAEATDHVKPLSKGGSNWPANLRPICTSCNSSKRDRWPLAA